MATYTFHGPNGQTVVLHGPANASRAEQAAALRAYLAGHPQATGPRTLPASDVLGNLEAIGRGINRFAEGAGAGVGRTLIGAAQLAHIPVPAAVVRGTVAPPGAAGTAGKFAGDTATLLAPIPGDKLGLAERFGTMAPAFEATAKGAVQAALQPAPNLATRFKRGLEGLDAGLALGAAGQAAKPALAGAADAARTARNVVRDPGSVAARVLRARFGSVANDLRKGASDADEVPGVVRTPAQAMPESGRVVREERTMRASPDLSPHFDEMDQKNDAARRDYLARFELTPEEAAAAVARRQRLSQRYIEAHLAGKTVPGKVIAQQLSKAAFAARFVPGVEAQITHIAENLARGALPDGSLPLGDILEAHNALAEVERTLAVSQGTSAPTREHFLKPVEDLLTATLEQGGGTSFRTYLKDYAEASAPLRASEAVQDLLGPGGSVLGGNERLSLAKFTRFLQRNKKAKIKVRGDGLAAIERVARSLANESRAARKMGPVGSNTNADYAAQRVFGNLYSKKGGPMARLMGGLTGSAIGHAIGVPGGYLGFIPGEMVGPWAIEQFKGPVVEAMTPHVSSAEKLADLLDRTGQRALARKAASQAFGGRAMSLAPTLGSAAGASGASQSH